MPVPDLSPSFHPAAPPARSGRPRIAVDLRALVPAPTGIGVFTREMLRRLAVGGSFDWLGLAHRPLHPEAGLDGLDRLTLETPSSRLPLGVLWQQLALPRRLGRGDVEAVWSPLQTLPLAAPVPGVVTVHDLTVLLMPESHRLKVRLSQVPFLERTCERAVRVVADSEATADELRRQFPGSFVARPEKLRVIHPGVGPEFRPGTDDEVAEIRHELGCPGGYLLFAGTLEPRKNVSAVLSAWEARMHEAPEATPPLVLAGGYGWRARQLVRRIQTLEGRFPGRLLSLGRVAPERLHRLFRAASVFLYPSWAEGFGLPVAEAMASGVPVVTSDRSSLPEVAGGAALLVRPEDPGQLAGAIVKLLEEPALAAELGERGVERARAFSWDAAARAMDQVLVEALADAVGPSAGAGVSPAI